MKKGKFGSLFNSAFVVILLARAVFAQTGGVYEIKQSVIASGGASSGSVYQIESTAGQTFAGAAQGAIYSVSSGFWTPNFAPTAAEVSLGGRVLTANGGGIQNARVMLTFPNGTTRLSSTGSFGYYRFNEIPVGETYVLTVFSQRFIFVNPSQIVNVTEELTELNFIAEP